MNRIPKIFKKYCKKCDELYQPTGKYQKYCEKCKIIIRKDSLKRKLLTNEKK